MAVLRQFHLLVLVGSLAVIALAEDKSKARHINVQDFITWYTTPRPETPSKPESTKPVYIYRPPKGDRPSAQHHPYYPYYPQYSHYPQYPYYAQYPSYHYPPAPPAPPPPQHYWPTPRPEQPPHGHDRPHDHHHDHHYDHDHHHNHHHDHSHGHPHSAPYGGYPYPHFYPPHGAGGQSPPYFIVINPSPGYPPPPPPPLPPIVPGPLNLDTDLLGNNMPGTDLNLPIVEENSLPDVVTRMGNTRYTLRPSSYDTESLSSAETDEDTDENIEGDDEQQKVQGSARSANSDGLNILADSLESNNSDFVSTKDVELPNDLGLFETRPRKRTNDQVALIYMRNYRKSRKLQEQQNL